MSSPADASCLRSGLKVACLLGLTVVSPLCAQASDDQAATEWFEARIRPVLLKHCYECHSADSKEIGGRLRLDFRDGLLKGGESGPAVVVGKPDQSLLLSALRYEDLEMPPDGRLPMTVVADFERWIQLGLTDPRQRPEDQPAAPTDKEPPRGTDLWSIQPLLDVAPPNIATEWSDSPIDRFIAARHAAKKLRPVADAPSAVLLRRLFVDLTGLPPTFAQIEHFEQSSRHDLEAALSIQVDRLLASPRFGERWGRYWLDVVRFAESNGNDRNVIFPHAWRYRDYVIRSFNDDKPFDQFIREQLAGDLLPTDDWRQRDEQLIATGFLAIGSKVLGEGDKELFAMNLIDDQIDVTTRAFLGLTVSCARCHDHKFDPVPTRDYYALAGIFGSTQTLYGPMTSANQYGFDRPLQPIGEHGLKLDEPAREYRKKVAEATAVRNKARSDRYRVVRKKAALENRKKKTTDAAEVEKIDAEIAPLDAEIAEWDEKIKGLDADLKKLTDAPPEFPDYCMAVCVAEQPADCAIRIRGEAKRKGEVVPRGVPTLFERTNGERQTIDSKQSGRRQLAEWLVSEGNALTPRVAVNRIWQRLFGEGIVPTVNNFGLNGRRPSHPQLLDWLARRFQSNGWSMKKLIREIVLSRTYRLGSDASYSNVAVDPTNSLLWRANIRRVDVEALRDAMLSVSGELVLDPPRGSVVSTFEEREFNSRTFPTTEQLESPNRSVYLPVARYWVPEMLATFDFADPSQIVGTRSERTMPSQSLFLMNSEFCINRAARIAAELTAGDDTDTARVRTAFRRILLRDPTRVESSATLALIRDLDAEAESDESLGWEAAIHALLISAEFRYLP
jgi:hypothetical protein